MIDVRENLAGPALRTFANIADAWRLSQRERRSLLGDVSATTYDRMRRAPDAARLGRDTLERISHVLAIYKALHVLYGGDYADRWPSEPNAAFGGATARERMVQGFTQLVEVRRLVDAARGW